MLLSLEILLSSPFKETLEKRKIRETARKIIKKCGNEESKVITLKLNKQAAYAGTVNLVEDDLSPLGEIEVQISAPNIETFTNWLCGEELKEN